MVNYFEVVLILVIVAMGFWAWMLYQDKQKGEQERVALEMERQEYEEIGKGLLGYQEKLQEKKELAKAKILDMLSEKDRIGTDEIANALKISSRTAVRYLDELEQEGKARQVGNVGKSVFYTK